MTTLTLDQDDPAPLTVAAALARRDAPADTRAGRTEQAGLACCLVALAIAALVHLVAAPMMPSDPLALPVSHGFAVR